MPDPNQRRRLRPVSATAANPVSSKAQVPGSGTTFICTATPDSDPITPMPVSCVLFKNTEFAPVVPFTR